MVGGGGLKPDLVIKKGKDILILDITVPFENGLVALEEARQRKIDKDSDLAKELSMNGCSASVEAIVVGSLGASDKSNERVVRRLCSRKYAKTMSKIIGSETITYSRNIFYEHVNRGSPQDPGRRQVQRPAF